MKTVICFDTEDVEGMKSACKILDHLSSKYLGKDIIAPYEKSFNKIQIIKALRAYVNYDRVHCESRNGLKGAKDFADEFFRSGKLL